MTDMRLLELQRRWKETGSVEDEAAYLLHRVRIGEFERTRLEAAAAFGHPAASHAAAASGVPRDEPIQAILSGRSSALSRAICKLAAWNQEVAIAVLGRTIATAVREICSPDDSSRFLCVIAALDQFSASEPGGVRAVHHALEEVRYDWTEPGKSLGVAVEQLVELTAAVVRKEWSQAESRHVEVLLRALNRCGANSASVDGTARTVALTALFSCSYRP